MVGCRTGPKHQRPTRHEQNINDPLFPPDRLTDLVHRLDEANIRLDEDEFASGVEFLTFSRDAIACIL
jgi:hypothetical protein